MKSTNPQIMLINFFSLFRFQVSVDWKIIRQSIRGRFGRRRDESTHFIPVNLTTECCFATIMGCVERICISHELWPHPNSDHLRLFDAPILESIATQPIGAFHSTDEIAWKSVDAKRKFTIDLCVTFRSMSHCNVFASPSTSCALRISQSTSWYFARAIICFEIKILLKFTESRSDGNHLGRSTICRNDNCVLSTRMSHCALLWCLLHSQQLRPNREIRSNDWNVERQEIPFWKISIWMSHFDATNTCLKARIFGVDDFIIEIPTVTAKQWATRPQWIRHSYHISHSQV